MRHQSNFLALIILSLLNVPLFVVAQKTPSWAQGTRTIIADILMIDGDFYVVRGERGEIRIEVTPDTQFSEEFKFGDRIKAVVLPGDYAVSIERAKEGEPLGITTQEVVPATPAPPLETKQKTPSEPESGPSTSENPTPTKEKEESGPTVRIVVAEILMVDGDFYVVRTEFGEIQIEVTPDTNLEESFKFGDRIKAHILPNDRAISVVRAKPEEPNGVLEAQEASHSQKKEAKPTVKENGKPENPASPPEIVAKKPNTRTIIAEILMVDGDFYVVRGERGEIRIEVTPDTTLSEKFQFGDKIKAKVLSTDEAVSVERARPDEPIGISNSE